MDEKIAISIKLYISQIKIYINSISTLTLLRQKGFVVILLVIMEQPFLYFSLFYKNYM